MAQSGNAKFNDKGYFPQGYSFADLVMIQRR